MAMNSAQLSPGPKSALFGYKAFIAPQCNSGYISLRRRLFAQKLSNLASERELR